MCQLWQWPRRVAPPYRRVCIAPQQGAIAWKTRQSTNPEFKIAFQTIWQRLSWPLRGSSLLSVTSAGVTRAIEPIVGDKRN